MELENRQAMGLYILKNKMNHKSNLLILIKPVRNKDKVHNEKHRAEDQKLNNKMKKKRVKLNQKTKFQNEMCNFKILR